MAGLAAGEALVAGAAGLAVAAAVGATVGALGAAVEHATTLLASRHAASQRAWASVLRARLVLCGWCMHRPWYARQ
jgi:hypothetical protein